MKLHFSKRVYLKNIIKIREYEPRTKFILKSSLLYDYLYLPLEDEFYTTKNSNLARAVNIYDSKDIVIIDAWESREGLTLDEAKAHKNKNTAIVNFYCCEGILPTFEDVKSIATYLKYIGYKQLSFGGTALLEIGFNEYSDLRIGEGVLTGFNPSTKKYIKGLGNPFRVEYEVIKETDKTILVPYGFLDIGGFTDAETICVNTELTVIKKEDIKVKGNKVILSPDYESLVKMEHNGYLSEVIFDK